MTNLDRIAALEAAKEDVRLSFHNARTVVEKNQWGKDVQLLSECTENASKKYKVSKEAIEIELMLMAVR
jgi:hypothetical protein